MSLPPSTDNYIGEPDYPGPWATKEPREGLRDTDEARIICLAPDVCKTPIGSSTPPIPYQVVDFCGHDANYTPSVRFTEQMAMVYRSNTTHVHGDSPGKAKGIKSGTVEDICEPIEYADQVRAEGSHVIRHLDKCHMNCRNTVGEAQFVRDTGTYNPPKDDDPVPGSLMAAGSAFNNPVQLQQADAGAGTIGSVPAQSTTTTSTAPAKPGAGLKRKGILGIVRDDLVRDFSMSASERAAEGRAMQTILSGYGSDVIREDSLLGGKQPITSVSPFSAAAWQGKYGLVIDPEDRIPLANDILSKAAGRPMDVRTMTDAEVGALLSEARSSKASSKSKNVRVTPRRRICFELPSGVNRNEFEKQLKEQQKTINDMTADEMGYANWVLEAAGSTKPIRDLGAQRRARQAYERQLLSEGKTPAQAARILDAANATHFLDIVAGGDPSRVGIGGAATNQEIGRQWIRDGRVQALRDEAKKMRQEGRNDEKMSHVTLEIC